jgi:hypothetical protein
MIRSEDVDFRLLEDTVNSSGTERLFVDSRRSFTIDVLTVRM